MKCQKTLFAFMFILMLSCNLNAQEASSEKTDGAQSVIADTLEDTVQEIESAVEADESATEEVAEDADAVEDDEATVDDEGEYVDEGNDGDLDEDEAEEYNNAPVVIRVNEAGQLVGQARASVSGNWLPVEANIALVSNGVLLNKIVADEDGSFAFPNIAPGSYNVYGTASSYCGQRTVTVVSDSDCCDTCGLGLTQDSQNACYSGLSSAPAATFSGGGGGGFSAAAPAGGFGGGGGGFVGGGGGAATGFSRLRLLAAGGIITAIAVGDGDDDVSPSN